MTNKYFSCILFSHIRLHIAMQNNVQLWSYKGNFLNLKSILICQTHFLLSLCEGETSAGKSSFLNLLLGADVLPHSLLSTTSTICRLHNIRPDQPRRFKISTNNGAPITRTIDEHTIDKLKEEISGRPPKRVQQMESQIEKEVDIYWPIPMLGEYVRTKFHAYVIYYLRTL